MIDTHSLEDVALIEQAPILPNLIHSNDRDGWDVEAVVEQIWVEVGGALEHTVIDQVIQELMLRHENARIKTSFPFSSREKR